MSEQKSNTDMTLAADSSPSVSMAARFQPHDLRQMAWLSNQMVHSGLFKVTPAQALAIMLAGAELGVMSLQALRSIYVIDGKPVLAAELMVALAKRNRGICKYFRMVESTDKLATYETWRVGDPEPTSLTVTIEQFSHLAHKTNWKQNAADMLRARCSSKLARTVYSDVFMGVYEPDEASEFSGAVYESKAVPFEEMPPPPPAAGTVEDQGNPVREAEMLEAEQVTAETVVPDGVADTTEAPLVVTESDRRTGDDADAGPPQAADEAPKRGRGRPPKPQEAAEKPQEAAPVAEPAPAPAEAPAPAQAEDGAANGYVNNLGSTINDLTRKGIADGVLNRDDFSKMVRDAKIDVDSVKVHGKDWYHYVPQDNAEILVYLLRTIVVPEEIGAELPIG